MCSTAHSPLLCFQPLVPGQVISQWLEAGFHKHRASNSVSEHHFFCVNEHLVGSRYMAMSMVILTNHWWFPVVSIGFHWFLSVSICFPIFSWHHSCLASQLLQAMRQVVLAPTKGCRIETQHWWPWWERQGLGGPMKAQLSGACELLMVNSHARILLTWLLVVNSHAYVDPLWWTVSQLLKLAMLIR